MFKKRNVFSYRYMDGEGEGEGEGGNNPPPKTFTQVELDEIIKKRLAKEKTEKETLIKELETLRQSQNLTKEEREKLSQRIDELENSALTEQQRAAKERARLEKQLSEEKNGVIKERDTWRDRYQNSTIERALTDAAVSLEAENPTQLRMMFRGSTKLVEEVVDGQATGQFVPVMSFTGLSSDGKSEEVFELPVNKALEKIKADGLNKNLFKHGATPGTGQPPTGGSRGKGPKPAGQMPEPQDFGSTEDYGAAYQQWRNDWNVDGTPRKKD